MVVESDVSVAGVASAAEPKWEGVDTLVLQGQRGHPEGFDAPEGLGGPAGAHAVALGGRPDPVDPFVDDVDATAVDLESGHCRGHYHQTNYRDQPHFHRKYGRISHSK